MACIEALQQRLGSPTIPQVLVGCAPTGHGSEALELLRKGELQEARLRRLSAFDERAEGGPAR